MLINYNNCNYLSPDNEAVKSMLIYGQIFGIVIQYICNKIMIIARRFDTQYQKYNKTIHKIFLEELPILLLKLDQTTRSKIGILVFVFQVIIGIASEAVSVFIKHK